MTNRVILRVCGEGPENEMFDESRRLEALFTLNSPAVFIPVLKRDQYGFSFHEPLRSGAFACVRGAPHRRGERHHHDALHVATVRGALKPTRSGAYAVLHVGLTSATWTSSCLGRHLSCAPTRGSKARLGGPPWVRASTRPHHLPRHDGGLHQRMSVQPKLRGQLLFCVQLSFKSRLHFGNCLGPVFRLRASIC